jgi:hypothetical protein
LTATPGVFTDDFPDAPPPSGAPMTVATRVKKLKYNSVVEVVLQNPTAVATENHPIHLHGYNFFVMAQGIGNFTPGVGYNLVDPVARNTIAVPGGGWAVIRFVANNPGRTRGNHHLLYNAWAQPLLYNGWAETVASLRRHVVLSLPPGPPRAHRPRCGVPRGGGDDTRLGSARAAG